MVEKNNQENQDLCSNEDKLNEAIKLFNDIFRLEGEENELYYFFSTEDVLSLLSENNSIGIKVSPALENNSDDNTLSITMAVKALTQNENDFRKHSSGQSEDSKQEVKSENLDADEICLKLILLIELYVALQLVDH